MSQYYTKRKEISDRNGFIQLIFFPCSYYNMLIRGEAISVFFFFMIAW